MSDKLVPLVHGGDRAAGLSAKANEILSRLHAAKAQLKLLLEAAIATAAGHVPDPGVVARQAVQDMQSLATGGAQALSAAVDQKKAAQKHYAVFLLIHGITRAPRNPNVAMSASVLVLLAIVEGVLTALFFLNGGFVSGYAEALALGLTISAVNIVLSALVGGMTFGRWWNYGVHAPKPDRSMTYKRWAGRVGSILTIGVLVALLIASGILRATGEPEHIRFTLENIGSAATNFHSLVLWALGASFSLLAWIHGLCSFSDSYPGFSEASQGVTRAEDDIRHIYEVRIEDVDAIGDDALDELEIATEEVEELKDEEAELRRTFCTEREKFATAIANASLEFSAYQHEQRAALRMMAHGDAHDAGEDISIADALAKLEQQLPDLPDQSHRYAEDFEAKRAQAEATIAKARTEAVQLLNEAYRRALS